MIDPDMPTLGIKDMHRMQVQALMDFVGTTINLAALTNDAEILEETEEAADELIRLFGGTGVRVTIELD
jgi:hypothetical protein